MGMGYFNNKMCMLAIFQRQSVENNANSKNTARNEYICIRRIQHPQRLKETVSDAFERNYM